MAASSKNDDGLISGINVTPLVDVVLVLLIILMVTAQFVAAQAIPMELPRAASGESVPRSVSISVDAQGALYLDGQAMARRDLSTQLFQLRRQQPDLQAVIAADGRVPHARVVEVMDLLRQLGILNFAFNVDPAKVEP